MLASAPLRVFISYSHDSTEHQARVREFAGRLAAEGMEVTFDGDVAPPHDGWRPWVEREVTAADALLLVVTPGYQKAFSTAPGPWPGPVLPPALLASQEGLRVMIPVVFSTADVACVPSQLARQTHYSAETDSDVRLLIRVLGGVPHRHVEPDPGPRAVLTSPLPSLDQHLASIHARLSFHRRAWRYFRSRLDALDIALEEQPCDETGAQRMNGPGISITLTQHSEHTEARLEMLPCLAAVYAGLLGSVASARQALDCTYLVFLMKPEWKILTCSESVVELLAGSDLELSGPQSIVVHGWRFVIPALSAPFGATDQIKIVPRPAYPWPLNPVRLLLYHMEKRGVIYR